MSIAQAAGEDFQPDAWHAFFVDFLHGILVAGLMPPLQTAAKGEGQTATFARDWYEAMLAGAAPDVALKQARVPALLCELLLEGIGDGTLDYVVQDILHALDTADAGAALAATLADYRARPRGMGICVGCVQRDLLRLLDRAATEVAVEVRVRVQAQGMMEQAYAGVYPVRVLQPARARVVAELKALLSRGGEVVAGVDVSQNAEGFAVTRAGQCVQVVFVQ